MYAFDRMCVRFIISNLLTKIVVSEKRVRGRGLRADGDGFGRK